MKQIRAFFLFNLLTVVLVSCQFFSNQSTKDKEDQLLKNLKIPMQSFSIDPNQAQVIVAEQGTRLVLPSNCFIDAKGKIVKGKVNIQLLEALTLDKMIQANLTTTSNGKILETGGMLYLRANSNGENLKINPANPIYVEIPTNHKKPGMKLYEGIRDEKGNINWINPKPLEEYLLAVDIHSLNFYPPDFEQAVDESMPFRNYKVADKALKDSLYYSLAVWNEDDFRPKYIPLEQPPILEVPDESTSQIHQESPFRFVQDEKREETTECSKINPLSIKAIKNDRFQNTLLATREFEKRLQWIFKTCEQEVLEIYIKNLDKNLWELDEMAYNFLVKKVTSDFANQFKRFAEQKLGKVKNGNKYATILKKFYEKEIKSIEAELLKIKKEAISENEKQNKIAAEKTKAYQALLVKREAHRKEAYGFIMTETGWVNVDIPGGTIEKDWGYAMMNVKLANKQKFDRVHFYLIFESIQALYGLQTSDNQVFSIPLTDKVEMPRKKKSKVIGIAYQGTQTFFVSQDFISMQDSALSVNLIQKNYADIEKELKQYDNYKKENNILVDLEFKSFFAKEKQRQERIWAEYRMMLKLKSIICACGNCEEEETILGRYIFNKNCISCHQLCGEFIGPPLAKITLKRNLEWFSAFTRNSQALIASGDKEARLIYEKYNKSVMTSFSFSAIEMKALYDYLHCQKDRIKVELIKSIDGRDTMITTPCD